MNTFRTHGTFSFCGSGALDAQKSYNPFAIAAQDFVFAAVRPLAPRKVQISVWVTHNKIRKGHLAGRSGYMPFFFPCLFA